MVKRRLQDKDNLRERRRKGGELQRGSKKLNFKFKFLTQYRINPPLFYIISKAEPVITM